MEIGSNDAHEKSSHAVPKRGRKAVGRVGSTATDGHTPGHTCLVVGAATQKTV
jgi:glyoxylase-like metal-dependent hydrolase (beta-lactamase superfamily II)